MHQYARWSAAGIALVTMISVGAAVSLAQDKEAVVAMRQATMKLEGPDLRAISDYAADKGTDQATAIAKAQELLALSDKLMGLWPAGTSSKDLPGKSNAKPEIWEQMDKFKALYAGQKEGEQKLLEAIQKGDKAAVQAAVATIGKGSCSTCHGTYREKV
ncbi:MAG TPA: cytochrome c [Stellaceae bacterium]|nr:cytochrome c [Stellaceae bacterium]